MGVGMKRFLGWWRQRRDEARRVKRMRALQTRLLALHIANASNEGSALR